jgi:hypothetical protein
MCLQIEPDGVKSSPRLPAGPEWLAYSIRINEGWRLIFQWRGADAHEVRIVDYLRG